MPSAMTYSSRRLSGLVEETKLALSEYESLRASASRRASLPTANARDKMEVLFYEQEIRELKRVLVELVRERSLSPEHCSR